MTVIVKDYSLKEAIKFAASCVWELLLLLHSGLYVGTVNPVVWYLSAMLLCMMILYPLLRKYPSVTKNILVPLICFFLMGYLLQGFKTLRNPQKWTGLVYKGLLRAMAELCLGILVYNVVKAVKGINLTQLGQVLLSMIKWGCYLSFFWYLTKPKASQADYFFTLVIAVAIGISFSGKSVDSRFFNNQLCAFLGQFSLPLYLSHYFYSPNLHDLLPASIPDTKKLLIYYGLSAVTAAFVMGMASLWRKNQNKVVTILRHLLIEEVH